MRLNGRLLKSLRRFQTDDLILLAAWTMLAMLVAVGMVRILRPLIFPALNWLHLTLSLVGLFIATELAFRFLLRRRYHALTHDEAGDFRMDPHIFTHFIPSSRSENVSEDGFRVTGRRPSSGEEDRRPTLYLTGDCTLFEEHLPPEETFAHQLHLLLPGFRILNAGTDHYTALHSYNRFVVDLLRGYRPRFVLFYSAANDVLSFIHHKDGKVKPDHSHMYRPWLSQAQLLQRVSGIPTATLKLIVLQLLHGGNSSAWDTLAEEINPQFQDAKNVEVARQLFRPEGFLTVLDLFHATCRTLDIRLVLSTYCYQAWDMLEEPRQTYAWGMDRLNESIRDFAREREIPLIDLAEEMVVEGDDILNKWHFTLSGNAKRVRIVARHLRNLAAETEGARHALTR